MTDQYFTISGQRTSHAQKYVLSIVVLMLLIFCIANFIIGLDWVNKPYPGFFLYKNLVITDISPSTKNGGTLKRFKDRVVDVNGTKVNRPKDVFAIINELPVGTEVEYTIARNGEFSSVKIPTERFSAKDLASIFGVIYGIGIVFLIIGILVLYLKPHLRASKAFFLFCTSIGIWFVGSFDAQAESRSEEH